MALITSTKISRSCLVWILLTLIYWFICLPGRYLQNRHIPVPPAAAANGAGSHWCSYCWYEIQTFDRCRWKCKFDASAANRVHFIRGNDGITTINICNSVDPIDSCYQNFSMNQFSFTSIDEHFRPILGLRRSPSSPGESTLRTWTQVRKHKHRAELGKSDGERTARFELSGHEHTSRWIEMHFPNADVNFK